MSVFDHPASVAVGLVLGALAVLVPVVLTGHRLRLSLAAHYRP